jgi:NAD(P)-dependent dehydrogenase (short-subunit alcohol dehydrogenase family)
MEICGSSIVVAGGKRIGGGLAELLALHGANLTLSYHQSRDEIEAWAVRCRTHGVQAETVAVDLRDPNQADALIAAAVNRFGRIDVLICLASIYRETKFADLTPADYDDLLASNLTAPYHTAIAAAQAMQRQPVRGGLTGKIVFFIDWAVDRPYRNYLPYFVAKGGLVTLTKALAVELAPTILVNAIAPGTVLPPADKSQERLAKIESESLLGRIGSPEDVQRLALYVLEGTDFATGEIYRCDGGRFLGRGI